MHQPVSLRQGIQLFQPTDNPRAQHEWGELGCPRPFTASPEWGDCSHLTWRQSRAERTFDDTHLFVWMFSLPRTRSCYSFSLAAGLARIPSPCPPRKPSPGSRWAFAAVPRPKGGCLHPFTAGRGLAASPPSSPQPMLSSRGCRDYGGRGGRGEEGGENKKIAVI